MSIWDYIEDESREKKLYPSKSNVMRDPFLKDTFDVYTEESKPKSQWKKIRRRIKRQIRKNFFYFQLLSVAAGAIVIIGLSVYLFALNNNTDANFTRKTASDYNITYNTSELDHIIDSLAALTSAPKQVNTTLNLTGEDKAPRTFTPVFKDKPTIQPEKKKKSQTEDQKTDYYDKPVYESNKYTVPNDEVQEIFSEKTPDNTQAPVRTNLNQTPKPAGGDKVYSDYLKKNRMQITDGACSNQHGKVILLFRVNENGRPVDISILRSLCQSADKEAIRLLQNGPNWTTGNKNALLEIDF